MTTKARPKTTEASKWRAYLAVLNEMSGSKRILSAFDGICRSEFDGRTTRRQTDAELLEPLSEVQLQQLIRLLQAQAEYIKPPAGELSFTSQIYRQSILDRVAPKVHALIAERVMRKVIADRRSPIQPASPPHRRRCNDI